MSEIKPINILLAEDNLDHAELMIDTLAENNIKNNIVHVTNGEKALAYLNDIESKQDASAPLPDLILLDIKMPLLDGIGTLAEIKKHPRFKHIPVIMITTSTTEKEIVRCYELGASSYVTKPLNFEDFTRKIRELNLYWVLVSELP